MVTAMPSLQDLLLLMSMVLTSIPVVQCYNISDPKTNLDFRVRTSGSIDPRVSSIGYFNGSVFIKRPGSILQKILNFEGYNINRKVKQVNGSVLSLSREIVVYREPTTSQILRVWINPLTSRANEVFIVANDPVNGLMRLGDIVPSVTIPEDWLVFNEDVILEYPNPLDPTRYSKYSAGPVYDAAELFSFFTNGTFLEKFPNKTAGFLGTWMRKSEYLPWMEMGKSPGHLYYSTMSWFCMSGLSCLADDLKQLVLRDYLKYTQAPSSFEVPNETSWTNFKRTIDSRRNMGLPDIIIPEVNVTGNVSSRTPFLDPRIISALTRSPEVIVAFNGTAWSEIIGQQPIELFYFDGKAKLVFRPFYKPGGYYPAEAEAWGQYRDTTTRNVLHIWTNPLTKKVVSVPPLRVAPTLVYTDFEMVYSMEMLNTGVQDSVGLIATPAVGGHNQDKHVNIINLIFPLRDLNNPHNKVFFQGTWGRFSSDWLDWMDMEGFEGNLVLKATVFRT